MMRLWASVLSAGLLLWLSILEASAHPRLPENRDFSETLAVLLSPDEHDIDLTWSKLVIDNLVDPGVDIDETNAKIVRVAENVLTLAGAGASAGQKVAALRTFIYKPGPWNGNHPFGYDFDNPNGRLAANKTIKQYMDTRLGNCVNMPLFFLIVGEKIGVKMNVSTAPRHMFIQFDNPDTGKVEHLETTSGALPQRIVWQRKVLPMTDRSIETGMYMKRLSKHEMIAVMAETLLQELMARDDQRERLEVAELILRYFPHNDVALMNAADSYRLLIERDYAMRYPSPEEIPDSERPQYEAWANGYYKDSRALVDLGWRRAEPNPNVVMPK